MAACAGNLSGWRSSLSLRWIDAPSEFVVQLGLEYGGSALAADTKVMVYLHHANLLCSRGRPALARLLALPNLLGQLDHLVMERDLNSGVPRGRQQQEVAELERAKRPLSLARQADVAEHVRVCVDLELAHGDVLVWIDAGRPVALLPASNVQHDRVAHVAADAWLSEKEASR